MVNLENLALLRDTIQTGDGHKEVGFNLFDWVSDYVTKDQSGRDCKTVACLGGWCMILSEGFVPKEGNFLQDDYIKRTAKFLNIEDDEAWNLCYSKNAYKSKRDITVEETLKVLDHLRDTGKIDWSIINEKVTA